MVLNIQNYNTLKDEINAKLAEAESQKETQEPQQEPEVTETTVESETKTE